MVAPAFGLVYLLAAPTSFWRRIWQLLVAGARDDRRRRLVGRDRRALAGEPTGPYIGGSQDNSILDLIFGYNGFGRLTGNETGSVIGAGGGPARRRGPGGHVGPDRHRRACSATRWARRSRGSCPRR